MTILLSPCTSMHAAVSGLALLQVMLYLLYTLLSCTSLPETPEPIDWDMYRRSITKPGFVDSFQKQVHIRRQTHAVDCAYTNGSVPMKHCMQSPSDADTGIRGPSPSPPFYFKQKLLLTIRGSAMVSWSGNRPGCPSDLACGFVLCSFRL